MYPASRGKLIKLLTGLAIAVFASSCQPRPLQAGGLECIPSALTEGDTLILKMPLPHGRELAAISPSGEYFMIVYHRIDLRSPLRPVMPSDEFTRLSEFRIDSKDFKAHPWREGANVYQKLFTISGKYQFLISDNLETDDGTPVLKCTINYQESKSKI